MEIGLYTFGDLAAGQRGPEAARQRLDEIVAAAKLADDAGLSVFGVGEHHRPDYAVPAPSVVLGALATATRRIRLTTAVTILSSDDPVRVFEQLAVLDLLSGGRAEITIGRGAFTESFPLFGFDLADYDALYDEKLALFLQLMKGGRSTGGDVSGRRCTKPPFRPSRSAEWTGKSGSAPAAHRPAPFGRVRPACH